jgi:hypothetical protein
MADDREYQRQTAAYAHTVNWLRHSTDLSEAELDARGLAAVNESIYGADAKKDRHGNYIHQGIGSPGHETGNHFAAIRRWEGKEAYDRAVAECWKRSPDHAKKLGLPQPRTT